MHPETTPIPTRFLAQFNRQHPQIWQLVDEVRAKNATPRPDGVFLNVKEAVGIATIYGKTGQAPAHIEALLGRMHQLIGLGAWRLGQDAYVFHPALYAALMDTEGLNEVPPEALGRLPAWGVYIVTPGLEIEGVPYHGFLAAPTYDDLSDGPALILTFLHDLGPGVKELSLLINLDHASIEEALGELVRTQQIPGDIAIQQALEAALELKKPISAPKAGVAEQIGKAISLLLYLCSDPENEDFPTERQPLQGKRVKGISRYFPVEKIRHWDVGLRIGAALENAERMNAEDGSGHGTAMRPHMRRAHWHTYYFGPRTVEKRSRRVRWLNPILVNFHVVNDDTDIPTVVHEVSPTWHQ